MENTARSLESFSHPRVVGHIDISSSAAAENFTVVGNSPTATGATLASQASSRPVDDTFLTGQTDAAWQPAQLQREYERTLAEISELQQANRWADIIAMFYPPEEKLPELVAAALDVDVRVKLSFALCQDGQHERAISCLQPAIAREPGNSLAYYSLGYAVVDFFFYARTARKIIPVKRRTELVALAHQHFSTAIELRPESVTFCYRRAILYKEIEDKPKLAAPLFRQAMANWRQLTVEQQQKYHQQKPKYIKSMYHLASCLLQLEQPKESLHLLETVLEEDRQRHHMHPLFKHFAMGKVLHALGRYADSQQHLETAAHLADRGQATDFVWELAARNALCLQQPEKAMACISRIEPTRRRPYVLWTEAAVLQALGKSREALKVLERSAVSDRRSRHVALIRMSRIFLSKNDLQQALQAARQAAQFCQDTYGNPSREARFWEAVCLYRLDRYQEAGAIVSDLQSQHFQYPNFSRLAQLLRDQQQPATGKQAASSVPPALQVVK